MIYRILTSYWLVFLAFIFLILTISIVFLNGPIREFGYDQLIRMAKNCNEKIDIKWFHEMSYREKSDILKGLGCYDYTGS